MQTQIGVAREKDPHMNNLRNALLFCRIMLYLDSLVSEQTPDPNIIKKTAKCYSKSDLV